MAKRKVEDIFPSTCKVYGIITKGSYGSILDIEYNEENCILKYFERAPQDDTVIFFRDLLREFYFGKFLLEHRFLGFALQEYKQYTLAGIVQKKAISSIQNFFPLSISQLKALFLPIVQQVQRLHHYEIMHRDIKPQNILCNDDDVYLIDASLSVRTNGAQDKNIVTLWYRAPEIFYAKDYTSKIDIWSLGIVFYEAILGTPWSNAKNDNEMYAFLQKEAKHKTHWSTDIHLNNLLRRMLSWNPDDRYSINDVVNDPFWSVPTSASALQVYPPSPKNYKGLASNIEIHPVQDLAMCSLDISTSDRIRMFDYIFCFAYDCKYSPNVAISAFFYWDISRCTHISNKVLALAALFVSIAIEQDTIPDIFETQIPNLIDAIRHILKVTSCSLFSAHILQKIITTNDMLWLFATHTTIWEARAIIDNESIWVERLDELKKNPEYTKARLHDHDASGTPISAYFLNK